MGEQTEGIDALIDRLIEEISQQLRQQYGDEIAAAFLQRTKLNNEGGRD